MCDKAVNTHSSITKFGPGCYKTQALKKCSLAFIYIPD